MTSEELQIARVRWFFSQYPAASVKFPDGWHGRPFDVVFSLTSARSGDPALLVGDRDEFAVAGQFSVTTRFVRNERVELSLNNFDRLQCRICKYAGAVEESTFDSGPLVFYPLTLEPDPNRRSRPVCQSAETEGATALDTCAEVLHHVLGLAVTPEVEVVVATAGGTYVFPFTYALVSVADDMVIEDAAGQRIEMSGPVRAAVTRGRVVEIELSGCTRLRVDAAASGEFPDGRDLEVNAGTVTIRAEAQPHSPIASEARLGRGWSALGTLFGGGNS